MVVVHWLPGTTRLAFVLLKRVGKTGIAPDHRHHLACEVRPAFDVRRGRAGPLRKRCPRETERRRERSASSRPGRGPV